MTEAIAQNIPVYHESVSENISLSDILSQRAYVTTLGEFLSETDTETALFYWLREFVPQNRINSTSEIIYALGSAIAEIDEIIEEQLNVILHHPKFQQLEASWRGLLMLVNEADDAQNIKIKMLDLSWTEISKDISRALEFDQSQLFHKVYNEEFGTPGGEPYGVLIGDYMISHKTSALHPHDDIATIEGISQVAAAAFSPFITSASAEFFGLDDFSELGQPINLDNIFIQSEYARWRSLREKPDSRFIGLTVPRILMRKPYTKTPISYKGLHYCERVENKNINNYLWGNACYAFGVIMLREFSSVGWFGHIRGVPRGYLSGGLVTNLPVDEFSTDSQSTAFKSVTEVIITDKVEKDLSELGFIPLCQVYNAPYAAFYNNQSIQLPKEYGSNDARVNARLSAMLQHIFCGSRFAHYIKIIVRDKIGSFLSASECESYLREWLYSYTTGREDLEWDDQARYPLREADIQVRENPMKPGDYACVIHLKPHYQLDHMVSELEMVTELASIG